MTGAGGRTHCPFRRRRHGPWCSGTGPRRSPAVPPRPPRARRRDSPASSAVRAGDVSLRAIPVGSSRRGAKAIGPALGAAVAKRVGWATSGGLRPRGPAPRVRVVRMASRSPRDREARIAVRIASAPVGMARAAAPATRRATCSSSKAIRPFRQAPCRTARRRGSGPGRHGRGARWCPRSHARQRHSIARVLPPRAGEVEEVGEERRGRSR